MAEAKTPKVTYQDVEKARSSLATTLRAFRQQKGQYHNPAPELPADRLADCVLLPNRLALYDRLPKGLTIAKAALEGGPFALELLKRTAPERLHLILPDERKLGGAELHAALAAPDGILRVAIGHAAEGLERLPDGSLDLVYLAGDQSYEGITRDIAAARPKIRDGGALLLSNYTIWAVAGMYNCGVARAVHELCLEAPWHFRYLALHPMMYHDVLLVHHVS